MMREPQDDGGDHPTDAPAVDAPVVAEPESFGTWLRRQREVREIDLREIADSTKVGMSYLRAFEDDRFDVLPASVFAKGFLRQYARYVGLDPEEVVNFYLAAREPQVDAEPVPNRSEPDAPARKYLVLAIVATAALVLLVWLLSFMSDRAPDAAPISTPEPAPERRPPAASPEPAPPAAPQIAPEPPAAESEAPPATEPVPPLRVTLDFLNKCWVEASVDGVGALSELKVQGESLQFDAEELVELKLGDAGAVEVEVNGMPFEIESRPGSSVRTLRIDLDTASRLQSPAPERVAEQP